jgi:hypothetical protein
MRHLSFAAALLLFSIPALAADVSGTWTMSLESPNGAVADEAPATGTLNGNDLKLSAEINAGGQSIPLVITGKIAGDKLEGSLDFAGQRSVSFTATKKP